jgi:hypothetical protein
MRYLREFAAEYRRLGSAEFAFSHGMPALVGLGVLGDLDDHRAEDRPTMGAVISTDTCLHEAESVIGRVWVVRKTHTGPQIAVGRESNNDVFIADYSVSHRQASFLVQPTAVWLTDQNSYNGTFVNDDQLRPGQPCALNNGDIVRFGRLTLVYHSRQGFLDRVANLASLNTK